MELLPYDNGLVVVQDNAKAFRRHYLQGFLRTTLEDMVKRQELSPEESADLKDTWGVQ